MYLKLALLILGIMLMTGCGIGGTSPSTRFYILKPLDIAETAQTPKATGETVGIAQVVLPGYLDRPQIITRTAGHLITLADYDHWAEDLADNINQVLVEQISSIRPNDSIIAHPWPRHHKVNKQIKLNILRFDGMQGGKTELKGSWFLLNGRGDQVISSHRFQYHDQAENGNYEALVASLGRLINQLITDMNQGLDAR